MRSSLVDRGAAEEHNASVRSRAQSSCGFGEYQHPVALSALVAARDGAVDDVGGTRAMRGPSSIQHIDARYTEGRAALTGEVGCSDLSEVTVKQHCCLETALR